MSGSRTREGLVLLLAVWVAAAAGARLEVSRQPVGNELKGFALAQQPQVRVVLDAVEDLVPEGVGTVNSAGGSISAPLHREKAPVSVDVTNFNTVTVSFGNNPVGATFAGGVNELRVKMVQGVADMDIHVMQGGAGFTLKFSVQDVNGGMLSVESAPFNCGGQEARLVLRQQPVVNSEGSTMNTTAAIIDVVDQYSRRLELANPVVSVSLFTNPVGASLSISSRTSVRAAKGVAILDKMFLTRAVTQLEPGVPQHLEQTLSTKFRLRFSSPGFQDVISGDFETLPLIALDQQPISDHSRTVTSTCHGVVLKNETSCMLNFSNYLNDFPRTSSECRMVQKPPGCSAHPIATAHAPACREWFRKCLDKLQTAHLHVDVACTDMDGPGEVVTHVSVGDRRLRPAVEFETGPWEGCGFAGCREQCDTNMRRVVSGLDVKDDIGSYDTITKIYSSTGPPLRVQVAISDKVNICPCDASPLKVTVRLVLTYSQAPEEQGKPLRQQPRVLLLNGDGSLYTHRQKFVSVNFASNPSGTVLAGTTRILSTGGIAQFSDLAITEGGKGYVLRFGVTGVYNPNSTSVVDSEPLNVGSGNFPRLTLECIDCSRPAPSRSEARSLSQPPQLELQKLSANGQDYVKTPSSIEVRMILGINGPNGMFSRDTRTARTAEAGSVRFSDTTILNGNCAFCPAGECGEGYTLMFITNDVALESEEFDIAGGNRPPRFIRNTPAARSTFDGVVGVRRVLLTLNMTDDNQDDFFLVLRSNQVGSVTCHPAATCLEKLNGGVQWGRKAEIQPRQFDDECSRPLCRPVFSTPQPDECGVSEIGPSFPPDGLYWGMSTVVTFTATCGLSSPEYPPLDSGRLAEEEVCFRPSDVNDRVAPPVTTHGEERCFNVRINTPAAPFFTAPFALNHLEAGIERVATPSADEAKKIAARTALLEFPAPPVSTCIPPHAGGDDGAPEVPGAGPCRAVPAKGVRALHVGVGCRMVLPVAAAEVQASVLSNDTMATRLTVRVLRTTRSSLYEQQQLRTAMPEGAKMHEGPKANPHVSSFEWEPARGQEGYVYTVCFEIVADLTQSCSHRFYTAPYHGHPAQMCVDIAVQRCKYCMRSGESLEFLARRYGTTPLQLWAGNALTQPNMLEVGTLLNLGIVYVADVDDRLPKIAQQMGRSLQEVLRWNPDLPDDHPGLLAGDEVLMSSATMYAHREAPWSVKNGTFIADSQALCMLPNICTFVPTVEGDKAFSCSTCEAGATFCTGALCIRGQGEAPWTREDCGTYRGSRCERCKACQQEEFDVDGRLMVPGTWRSGGCDGERHANGTQSAMAEEGAKVLCEDCTSDSTCSPCTECLDGEVEMKPCTPLSDRVCVAAGPTVGSDGKIVPPPKYGDWHDTFLPAPK